MMDHKFHKENNLKSLKKNAIPHLHGFAAAPAPVSGHRTAQDRSYRRVTWGASGDLLGSPWKLPCTLNYVPANYLQSPSNNTYIIRETNQVEGYTIFGQIQLHSRKLEVESPPEKQLVDLYRSGDFARNQVGQRVTIVAPQPTVWVLRIKDFWWTTWSGDSRDHFPQLSRFGCQKN